MLVVFTVFVWYKKIKKEELSKMSHSGCVCYVRVFLACVLWAGSSTDFEPLCGRPHALRLDRHGQLIVADSYLGLHSVDPKTGRKTLLVSNSQGDAQLSHFSHRG